MSFSLHVDLKAVTESLSMTVFGSEFQMAGTEQRKARFANVVLSDMVETATCWRKVGRI